MTEFDSVDDEATFTEIEQRSNEKKVGHSLVKDFPPSVEVASMELKLPNPDTTVPPNRSMGKSDKISRFFDSG